MELDGITRAYYGVTGKQVFPVYEGAVDPKIKGKADFVAIGGEAGWGVYKSVDGSTLGQKRILISTQGLEPDERYPELIKKLEEIAGKKGLTIKVA